MSVRECETCCLLLALPMSTSSCESKTDASLLYWRLWLYSVSIIQSPRLLLNHLRVWDNHFNLLYKIHEYSSNMTSRYCNIYSWWFRRDNVCPGHYRVHEIKLQQQYASGSCEHKKDSGSKLSFPLWPDFDQGQISQQLPDPISSGRDSSSTVLILRHFLFAPCQDAVWFQSWTITIPDVVSFGTHNLLRDLFWALKSPQS